MHPWLRRIYSPYGYPMSIDERPGSALRAVHYLARSRVNHTLLSSVPATTAARCCPVSTYATVYISPP